MFHRRKLLPLYIAATLASGQVAAVGLGDISLHSYLGKPLQAEVALSHMGDLAADQLKIQIGSESDYNSLGVEYNYLHSRLKIEPFTRNGQTFVRITTSEPISEPYLNFVLNLRWPSGQVMREFTVLLDPAPDSGVATTGPVAGRGAMAAAVDAQESAIEQAVAETPAEVAPRPAHRVRAGAPRTEPRIESQAEPRATVAGSYTTRRGDSLWRLAAKLRPSSAVSVERMMAALHSANPDAFIGGDAARLKEAATLDVAAAERIALGGAPAAAAVADSGGPAVAPAVPAAAAAPVGMTNATTEGLVQENAALKAQVAELSQNVSTLNTSLSASTDRLHEMENRLDSLLQQFQQQRTGAEAPAAVAGLAQPGSMINQANAAELRPAPQAHTPWWVHMLYWSGIAGAVAWAIREHFWPTRRLALAGAGTSRTAASPEPAGASYRVVSPSQPAPQAWEPPAEEALTLDLGDLMSPEAEDTAPAEIELGLPRQPEDQVDPSISAGVFVAFGRFDEAERLLTAALREHPARDDLRLQLLDVYLQSDQGAAFEQLAQAIEASPASPETLAELAVLRDSFQSRS